MDILNGEKGNKDCLNDNMPVRFTINHTDPGDKERTEILN